jgi:hypothetical protein
MMSKVVNEYGAFHGSAVDSLEEPLRELERHIKIACEDLDEVDIHVLDSWVNAYTRGIFAEITIRRGLTIRKAQREEAKRLRRHP